jgi:hypothetical protein
MALADDLLAQAVLLTGLDATRPKQASLRRAVSTAYYAVFHLLLAACVRKLAPSVPASLGPRIARALAHSEIKDVCLAISKNNPGVILQGLMPSGFSAELRRVAQAFVRLQEARHHADYDLAITHDRVGTLYLVDQARAAFADWRTIQNSEEATVFLSALLFARRWSK